MVPADWIAQSTLYNVRELGPFDGWDYGAFGELWWVTIRGKHMPGVDLGPGAYSARGMGGHYLFVIPAHDLVIVHRVDTERGKSVEMVAVSELLSRILSAKER